MGGGFWRVEVEQPGEGWAIGVLGGWGERVEEGLGCFGAGAGVGVEAVAVERDDCFAEDALGIAGEAGCAQLRLPVLDIDLPRVHAYNVHPVRPIVNTLPWLFAAIIYHEQTNLPFSSFQNKRT